MLYNASMELANPLIQIKKGALDFCVLALIARGESYGYEIVKTLGEQGLTTSEGTVYPLLARLQKEGLVIARGESSAWRQMDEGNPRKYYRITGKGEAALALFKEHWVEFVGTVDQVLEGGVKVNGS
jgi:PadR family transcriptional regulator PadR